MNGLDKARERQLKRRARDAAKVVEKLLDYPWPTGIAVTFKGEKDYLSPSAAHRLFRDMIVVCLEGLAARDEVPQVVTDSLAAAISDIEGTC